MVNEKQLEQARGIIEVVRMLRRRVIERHAALMAGQLHAGLELTMPQLGAVHAIRDRGQVSIKELAAALGVSAPSASAMVERLVELRVVTREQNPADRREVVVRLSAESEAMVDQIERHLLTSVTELLDKIGEDWAEQWCAVYARVKEVLEEEEAGGGQDAAGVQ